MTMSPRTLVGVFAFGLATSAPATTPVSPLLGTWSVDVGTLPMPAQDRPKNVTITFDDVGNGQWVTDVNIIDADGTVRHSRSTHLLAGTPAKVFGSDEADTVSVKVTEPNVLIMALSKGGEPRSMRVFNVRPDGKSETETMVYFKPDGTPAMRTVSFLRVK